MREGNRLIRSSHPFSMALSISTRLHFSEAQAEEEILTWAKVEGCHPDFRGFLVMTWGGGKGKQRKMPFPFHWEILGRRQEYRVCVENNENRDKDTECRSEKEISELKSILVISENKYCKMLWLLVPTTTRHVSKWQTFISFLCNFGTEGEMFLESKKILSTHLISCWVDSYLPQLTQGQPLSLKPLVLSFQPKPSVRTLSSRWGWGSLLSRAGEEGRGCWDKTNLAFS